MWKQRGERKRDERERKLEELSRRNLYYAYNRFKKYPGPSGYEATIKKLVKDFKI